jgi:hypothetical protein
MERLLRRTLVRSYRYEASELGSKLKKVSTLNKR